jgi:hypothetical protein
MEKKPLYADADPDDTRLQPVPPPPVNVVQADVNQYKGKYRECSFLLSLQGSLHCFSQSWCGRGTAHALLLTAQVLPAAPALLHSSQRSYSHCASVYVGNFDAGDFSGEGLYNYNSGSQYSGSWLKGKMAGKGKYVTKNGDSYEGEYRDGHREGTGTLLFAVGIHYQGDFVNGCGEGKGTLLFPSGSSYEGQFKDELPHGSGVLSYANGCRCEGEFAKGRMHGCCKFFFPDGNVCALQTFPPSFYFT